jgi:hypothetical protein
MLKVAEYRQHAADCRNMAAKTKDPDQRKMLEDMAAAWEGLATEREKFLKLKPAGVLVPEEV